MTDKDFYVRKAQVIINNMLIGDRATFESGLVVECYRDDNNSATSMYLIIPPSGSKVIRKKPTTALEWVKRGGYISDVTIEKNVIHTMYSNRNDSGTGIEGKPVIRILLVLRPVIRVCSSAYRTLIRLHS